MWRRDSLRLFAIRPPEIISHIKNTSSPDPQPPTACAIRSQTTTLVLERSSTKIYIQFKARIISSAFFFLLLLHLLPLFRRLAETSNTVIACDNAYLFFENIPYLWLLARGVREEWKKKQYIQHDMWKFLNSHGVWIFLMVINQTR